MWLITFVGVRIFSDIHVTTKFLQIQHVLKLSHLLSMFGKKFIFNTRNIEKVPVLCFLNNKEQKKPHF